MTFNELNNWQHTLYLVKTMNTLVEYYEFLKDVVVLDLDELNTNKYGGYNTDNLIWVSKENSYVDEIGVYLLRKVTNYERNFLYAQLYKVTIL